VSDTTGGKRERERLSLSLSLSLSLTTGGNALMKCTDEWQSMKDTTLYELHYEFQPTLINMHDNTGANALMNGNACMI